MTERPAVIDLRSDTVTLPSEEMRRAIAEAAVGDDVYGEDPSVRTLEDMAAERTGKEAAVFVASGTMSNLVAVLAHCERGDEVICGEQSHVFNFEAAGASAVAGVQLHTLPEDPRGRMQPDDIAAAIRPQNVHYARTSLLMLENTHNLCGGAAVPLSETRRASDVAREQRVKVHIDGARIFNAALALETTVASLAEPADSIGFCLSKGLGAPVGSVLCGSGDFIERARRARKMLGGGMRQAGILAAAGAYALEHMVDRLAEDHQNAKALARGLTAIPGVVIDADAVETNIAVFGVRGDGRAFAGAMKDHGVLTSPRPGGRFRAVTHYGITSNDIDEALVRVRAAVLASA